jgi:two-component system chemotaxis response regulator CheB
MSPPPHRATDRLPAAPKIRVLVVEDSLVVRDFLTHILNSVPDFQVVGVAHDGEQAITMVRETRPDVVTMDIHMPKMDGFEATRRIMETQATPIVIVSASSTVLETVTACRALGAGAVAVEARPFGFGHPEFEQSTAQLVETLRLMAGIKVVRRWAQRDGTGMASHGKPLPAPVRRGTIRLAAIGASTGGPAALATILAKLPPELPFPVVIVQHICDGFTAGLAEWLGQVSSLPVRVAAAGELLRAGQIYIAPSGVHLGVNANLRATFGFGPLENGVRPAISHLFRSVAGACGSQAIAVLLTGMGVDGAAELKWVRDAGGITVAQDEASSIVHGMPGEAIRLGSAEQVLRPEAIGALLRSYGSKTHLGS